MKNILVLLFVALLIACGGGGGKKQTQVIEPLTPVSIKCADVYQAESHCEAGRPLALSLVSSAHAAIEVDAGIIQRWVEDGVLGAPVIRVDMANGEATPQDAWLEIVMTGDCGAGAETPRDENGIMIVFPKHKWSVPANGIATFQGSNMCSVLELGDHQITAKVFDSTGANIVDWAIINFTLVE